ncbi:exodeoxyribonuclease V subunit gamma [Catenovulum sediminis]|uniref:exodeoxyribonuclease V subunit gamma n=1 Tax=Catenovulum sediminis TaxID=1740262 RepID=UPI00117D718D|nr:exodeoxyribonuclease V subunit gamma [Catenovulum sediminis]
MFTLYPSNRLEDLAILLAKVLENRQGGVLSQDVILVESQGMQHWLNMQLAQQHNIAMNISYPMPSRFIWNTARKILGSDNIPQQSPYRREVLSFRIDAILQSATWAENSAATKVNQYWQDRADSVNVDNFALKRFQLAGRLADLFEQYMLYRPDWILAWEAGERVAESEEEIWQAELWRLLVKENPYHPVYLQDQALLHMANHAEKLPKQILIFGVNTMPPKTLEFFQAIAEHIHVHLFHLNPCVSYWGDIKSEKALARQQKLAQLDNWVNAKESIGNPLLANLGGQGRAFFNSLQSIDSFEISAFDISVEDKSEKTAPATENDSPSVLSYIQQDILHLTDKKQAPVKLVDDSIYVVSAHSALREIQSLHDYLLHQFQQNPDLKPQDIIVMCPAIEDYAPYIDAVFKHPHDEFSDISPRLPCSIADRRYSDSEPLVNSFLELLQLPDSRLEISKILEFLRLPSLQDKFALSEHDLPEIEWWLQEAHIHWGLNAQHKQSASGVTQASDMYTWSWGLEKLLMGFAWGDSTHLTDDALFIPHVEGQQALLLGRLCHLLERLKHYSENLNKARSIKQWHEYLSDMLSAFFTQNKEEEQAFLIIQNAINSLSERAIQAEYQEQVELDVVRYYLQQQFNQADDKNQFLTGQITFCSMVPMRSIPFKIIAVLGLNEGVYPRQQTPISFDLMAKSEIRLGDRSRRADDRYLFLEALISARQSLYLSYQGKNIRNNERREASLVLKDLMGYLQQGYQWSFDEKQANTQTSSQLIQSTLHPFAVDNYLQPASFDKGWFRLIKAQQKANIQVLAQAAKKELNFVHLSELISWFKNPLAGFAKHNLSLNLEIETKINLDVEPFSANNLTRYQLTQALTEAYLDASESLDRVKKSFSVSGVLPETPLKNDILEEGQQTAELIASELQAYLPIERQQIHLSLTELFPELLKQTGESEIKEITEATLNAAFDVSEMGLVISRPATRKSKDDLTLWLHHLLVNSQAPGNTFGFFLNYDKTKIEKVMLHAISDASDAQQLLQNWLKYWLKSHRTPMLLHADIAKNLFKPYLKSLPTISELMQDEKLVDAWLEQLKQLHDSDPYFSWFYPQADNLPLDELKIIIELYYPLYENLITQNKKTKSS